MNKSLILRSALVVVSGSMAAMPAAALELGEVQVQSSLGQPLNASVAYTLRPFETITGTCVTVQPTGAAGTRPRADIGSVVVTDSAIVITGGSIVREPLISMRVAVNCKYTPRLTRNYEMFVDPAGATPIVAPTPERTATQPRPNARPARRAPTVAPRRSVVREPVITASNDTSPASDAVAVPDIPAQQGEVYDSAAFAVEQPAEQPIEVPEIVASRPPVAELQPGDVIIRTDNPYVEPVEAETTSTSPTVPLNVIRPTESAPSSPTSSNWLLWLGGTAGAIILALMLLGGRVRKHFGSSPVAPSAPRRNIAESQTETVAAVGEIDMEIDDDSPTAENPALDADLFAGTGLVESGDVDVSQDFGFAQTTELDLELPEDLSEELADDVGEEQETNIMPPLHANEGGILDSEVLADDDDYDLSMVVDATNMPNPDDVTERDLEAIQLENDDETLIGNDYTVSKEVDYKIVEQDYEDEMTATQALNEEILNATTEAAANESSKDGKKAS